MKDESFIYIWDIQNMYRVSSIEYISKILGDLFSDSQIQEEKPAFPSKQNQG